MKRTKKIALAGIFTALCTLFLFLGSVFQTLDLSAAAIGSVIILIAFVELGKGWAFGIYAAASVLSVILIPYKTAAVVFALFAGYYPILKEPLNRIKPIWLSYTARLVCFNICLTIFVYLFTTVLKIEESFIGFGIVIYCLANIAFVAFDFALERLAVYYTGKIRPLISRRR